MYRRLAFLPTLLVFISLACSNYPSISPTRTVTPPVEMDLNPQAVPSVTSMAPKLITPVPSPIPATPESVQEPEPANLAEEEGPLEMLYKLQAGSPAAISNTFHPELECNWMGVGGQVFAESGQPVGMLVVELGGVLDGEEVSSLTLTGSASQWGPGGFEFLLAQKPILSTDSMWIQVLDLEGNPLSEKVYFDTFESCEQAAILVNFNHISSIVMENFYLPVVVQNP